MNNVVVLAKTAKVFRVPTILTTVLEERGRLLIKDVQNVFPDQRPINPSFINAWENERIVEAVKKTGSKKLVIAALWTEVCLAMPAIQAQGEDYDIYAVTDASVAYPSKRMTWRSSAQVHLSGKPLSKTPLVLAPLPSE